MAHDLVIRNGNVVDGTLCNGRVILRDDEHTGVSAGEVLRNAAAS